MRDTVAANARTVPMAARRVAPTAHRGQLAAMITAPVRSEKPLTPLFLAKAYAIASEGIDPTK